MRSAMTPILALSGLYEGEAMALINAANLPSPLGL
jgi:hypothetical protein